MSEVTAPYQLLEINVISAQDLAQVSKSVRAYAVVWLHPERKLTTKVDQEGNTNPTWNHKFVFNVHDHFLNSENSLIMIQIYSHSFLRHFLIGTVAVLVSNLLPPNRKPKLSFVALQIRRPSGRPQGILNIGLTLLDSTMRSMPLYSDLSSSAVDYWDLMESRINKNTKTHHQKHSPPLDSTLFTLQRCQSEKNHSTINDYNGLDSELGVQKGGFFNEGSLISDVVPSPSVVAAAAIAKGLHPMPPPAPRTAESSAIDGRSENSGMERMKTKIERWRTELALAYEDYDDEQKKLKQTPKHVGETHRRRGGPYSCFGSVFGVGISITCGGGNPRKRHGGGKGRLTTASSELTFYDSYI